MGQSSLSLVASHGPGGRDAGILYSFPTREEIIVRTNVKWNCFVVPHVTHVLVCNYPALSQATWTNAGTHGGCSTNHIASYWLLVFSNHINQNKSLLLFILSPYLILNSGSKRVSGPEADCRVCPEPRIGFRFPKMNGNKCCSYQN